MTWKGLGGTKGQVWRGDEGRSEGGSGEGGQARLTLQALAAGAPAGAVEIDNGVVGLPQVNCEEDKVSLIFNTERPFGGRIFVKGMSGTDGCVTDYAGNQGSSVVFQMGSGGCNMRRQRRVRPPSLLLGPLSLSLGSVPVPSNRPSLVPVHPPCPLLLRTVDDTVTEDQFLSLEISAIYPGRAGFWEEKRRGVLPSCS